MATEWLRRKDPPRARTSAAGAHAGAAGARRGCGRARRGCGRTSARAGTSGLRARTLAAGAHVGAGGRARPGCGRARRAAGAHVGLRAARRALRGAGELCHRGPAEPSLSTGGHCGNPDLLTVPSGAWVWLPGVRDRNLTWSHQRRGPPSHVWLQVLSGFHAIAFTPFRSHASHFRETSEGVGRSSSRQSGTSVGRHPQPAR